MPVFTLGSVFFSININDLYEGITNVILNCADYTTVFGKLMDDKDKGMLQTDLNKLIP